VGLLKALGEYKGIDFSKEELARIACEIEIDDLQEPIGKQDQYAAAFGGINHFIFHPNGDVEISPLADKNALESLITDSCLLVRIGSVRTSRSILADQAEKVRSGINFELLANMAEMTNRFCAELPKSCDNLGPLLRKSWELKSQLAQGVTNEEIETTLQDAKSHGAAGGKLLGAGQSGYVLLTFPNRAVREIYINQFPNKSRIVLPGIDETGCTVIFRSEPK
jgi:D-glycero-alpha-D-manno-heptose-7-phosphate kinase